MILILNFVQGVLVCGLCLYGIWELWRSRHDSASNPIWYAALIALVIMLALKLSALVLGHGGHGHPLYLLTDVLFVALVAVGTGRIRVVLDSFKQQLARKRKAEAELARNRERLQQLIGQRTEALRGEILQRKALQDDLARYSTALENDLNAAARAQTAMQQALPQVAYLQMAAQTFARDQVNGDMYFASHRDNGGVDVLVGDAMGHGAAAGFVTVLTRTAMRIMANQYSPGGLLEQLNRLMTEQQSGVYLTAVMARIDASGNCCVAHAGHPPAMHIKPDGSVQPISTGGFALGMFDLDEVEFDMQEHELQLAAGDRVLMYSDGLTELRNENGEEFGSQRLIEAVCAAAQFSLDEALSHTLETAYDFCGSRAVDDDVTLLLVEYCP